MTRLIEQEHPRVLNGVVLWVMRQDPSVSSTFLRLICAGQASHSFPCSARLTPGSSSFTEFGSQIRSQSKELRQAHDLRSDGAKHLAAHRKSRMTVVIMSSRDLRTLPGIRTRSRDDASRRLQDALI